jgi:Ser/Thr protein kinase RdoA (MazF antagonist)
MSFKNKYQDSRGNLISVEEIEWICEQHELGTLHRVIGNPTKGNINGIIFIQTKKGKYAIRYMSIKTNMERIKFIEDALSTLQKEGLPVVRAVKTKEFQYSSMKDHTIIQVYPYIHGFDFMFYKKQIVANAKTLNKFHCALSSFDPGPLPDIFIYPTLENLENKIQILSQNKEKLSGYSLSKIITLYKAIEHHWQKFNPSYLPKTVIHDDWHPWNMIYHSDGSVAAILDYDYMQQGERIYDIAYALYYFYKRAPGDPSKLTQLFLDSYGDLLEIELAILPIVIAKVALFNIIFATNSNSERKVKKAINANEYLIYLLLSKV